MSLLGDMFYPFRLRGHILNIISSYSGVTMEGLITKLEEFTPDEIRDCVWDLCAEDCLYVSSDYMGAAVYYFKSGLP